MQSYAKFISKVQNVGFGVDAKTGKALTKYLSPPEIYMQKELVLKNGTHGELDHKQIAEAVKVLQEMRPVTIDGKLTMSDFWLKSADYIERKLTLPAMQHIFFEIERKYTLAPSTIHTRQADEAL